MNKTGLGLRKDMFNDSSFSELSKRDFDFIEVAPENWIDIGGELKEKFNFFAHKFPITLHGLSLSIGSYDPLDMNLLKKIKSFMREHKIKLYSEHLSFCSHNGHMYDLMPVPFNEEAIKHISDRIKMVQDVLETKISLENISYYYEHPENKFMEADFIRYILEEADCNLLLDVNNLYVNSINHKYNSQLFLEMLPKEKINYIHVAGHYNEDVDLKIDTHGTDVIKEVWDLLELSYQMFGIQPTLLERDFNIPNAPTIMTEINKIKAIQNEQTNSKTFF